MDSQELTSLFNEQGVMVSQSEIAQMYGGEPVRFSLQMFDQMTKKKVVEVV